MLYEQVMENCHIVDKTTVKDDRGGVETVYIEGAGIDVAFSFDNSNTVVIGNQETVTDLYTLVTYRKVVLQAGDIIERDKNGDTFKIEDNGDDSTPPAISALNMRQVKARKWKLPSEIVKKENTGNG